MSALRKGWCPGALRPMEAKDGLLVRLRLTGGILPAATAHALADLAARHGNGLFDLTARGNLQMRGVRDAELASLQGGLHDLGLLDASAAGESVRNVIASPLAGLHDGLDIRPLVAALERRLADDATLHALPGKFGFLINDGSHPTLAGVDADVRFDWTGESFAVGLGGARENAAWVGHCGADDLVARATEIASDFLDRARADPEMRRMRDALPPSNAEATFSRKRETEGPRNIVGYQTFDETGLEGAAPLPLVGRGEGWGSGRASPSAEKSTGTPTPCPSPQGGGERRPHRISSWLGVAAPFGRLDADMLHAVADVAAETPLSELRLTPWRVILIPDASHPHALPGFITDPADPRLSVAACPGAHGCARGSTDTHADAAALAAVLPPSPGVALHVSGCEKGCAKPSTTPLTLIAHHGRYDLVRNGRAGDAPTHRNLDLDAVQKILALEPA